MHHVQGFLSETMEQRVRGSLYSEFGLKYKLLERGGGGGGRGKDCRDGANRMFKNYAVKSRGGGS